MRIRLIIMLTGLLFAATAEGTIAIITSRCGERIEFRVKASGGETVTDRLEPGGIYRIDSPGDVQVTWNSDRSPRSLNVESSGIYCFVPKNGETGLVRLNANSPVWKSAPRTPPVRPAEKRLAEGEVTVKILFDDREPETQRLWEPRLRRRVEAASDVLQRHTGMRLVIVGCEAWKVKPEAKSYAEAAKALKELNSAPARLTIGFTRQYRVSAETLAELDTTFGPFRNHILVPDSSGAISSDESLNLLLHALGHCWGGAHVPTESSYMGWRLTWAGRRIAPRGYDAANAMTMSVVAEEARTRGIARLEELSSTGKARFREIYTIFEQTLPQDAAIALAIKGLGAEKPEEPAFPVAPKAAATPRDLSQAGSSHTAPVETQSRPLPTLAEISVPDCPGGEAIGGAIGEDGRGGLWYAVSCAEASEPSARLFRLDRASGKVEACGDVVSQLRAAGKHQPGRRQGAVFSPIATGADGDLYFASVDEASPAPKPERAPSGGSHLWRVRTADRSWQHLAAVPEGVVAVAVGAGYLYALGYPDHVLIQYDLKTRAVKRLRVGCFAGHVCRNLMMDGLGRVYVPRVRNGIKSAVELIECDERLQEIGATRLEAYGGPDLATSRGIPGWVRREDGSCLFVTDSSALHEIEPGRQRPARVKLLMANERVGVRVMSLAADGHGRMLAAAESGPGSGAYQWLVYDLTKRSVKAYPLAESADMPGMELFGPVGPVATDRGFLAGSYRRGPVSLSPALVDFLKERGRGEDDLARLRENAARMRQPLLFSVR